MTGQARALTESMAKEVATAATALSFDEAFTLHHRAVFRTARSVVRDPALAEDVTQEVFLRLYRNLDATPGEDLLRAWLLRVTLNVARNTLRGQSRSMARDNEYHKETMQDWFAPRRRKIMNAAWRSKAPGVHWKRSKSPCAVACF